MKPLTFLSRLAISILGASILTVTSSAKELPVYLSVSGENFSLNTVFSIHDVNDTPVARDQEAAQTEKNATRFYFKSKAGKTYQFDLKYKALPANRSYPTNLDITLKDGDGNKLGYLFWATNHTDALKQIGTIGMVVDIEGKPVDIKLVFDKGDKGDMTVKELDDERFVSDTLIPKKGFQMIRPVLIPSIAKGLRKQAYDLDAHPFKIDYTLTDLDRGLVQFQYNLYQKTGSDKNHTTKDKDHLLARFYYNADSLETLRSGMFAGKYFDKDYGTFKLVFYPALGQTEPPK